MKEHPAPDLIPAQNRESDTHKSRVITKVLSPAVRLWLRSLTSAVSDLEVKISGGDRQIISGYIPRVLISASRAVYQGLHLTRVRLEAENIRINIGAMLRGKPLQLIEPIPVAGEILLFEKDLNASLSSPLLSNALTDLLVSLIPEYRSKSGDTHWYQITIESDQVILLGTQSTALKKTTVEIRFGLKLASCNELQLLTPQVLIDTESYLGETDLNVDLGPEVNIQELTLTTGQVFCRGGLTVMP